MIIHGSYTLSQGTTVRGFFMLNPYFITTDLRRVFTRLYPLSQLHCTSRERSSSPHLRPRTQEVIQRVGHRDLVHLLFP